MSIDKNNAFIDYLLKCPQMLNSPLYFNFINAKDNTNQIVTNSDDRSMSSPYVDGSVKRRYTYTIITFKSITDIPLAKAVGTDTRLPNENVEDLASFQAIIDWIAEQADKHEYPDFGENCQMDDIYTTTDAPRFDGINTDVSPSMAMYSIDIVIDYIDISKAIWKQS